MAVTATIEKHDTGAACIGCEVANRPIPVNRLPVYTVASSQLSVRHSLGPYCKDCLRVFVNQLSATLNANYDFFGDRRPEF